MLILKGSYEMELIWTREKPKIAGQYWYERFGSSDICTVDGSPICSWEKSKDSKKLVIYRDNQVINIEHDDSDYWAGPIPKPVFKK